jgi:uncharacterized protein
MSIALTPAAPATPFSADIAATSSIARGERLDVLDVLRGIALLGMYAVHFSYYVRDVPEGPTPLWQRLQWWFLDERFFTMFAMLFGIGFAVQLARADARGENIVPRYLRRLGALAIFGLIAQGVFGFNVLISYAIWGLALLPIRRWSTKAIFVLFLLCSAHAALNTLAHIAIAESRGRIAEYVADRQRPPQEFLAARKAVATAAKSAGFGTLVAARMRLVPRFQRQFGWNAGGSFTLMLAGLLAFRLGVFEDPRRKRKVILWGMVAGAASFVIANWVLPLPGAPPMKIEVMTTSAHPTGLAAYTLLTNNGFGVPRVEWLAFVYIGIVLLLVARDRAWLRRLAPFAWNGRMALTNYMVQVAFLDSTFSHYGLGLDGVMSPRWIPLCAIGLFGVQAVFARWWLSRYEYGPLEWVWRSVTYWRPARFRRIETAGVPLPAAVAV